MSVLLSAFVAICVLVAGAACVHFFGARLGRGGHDPALRIPPPVRKYESFDPKLREATAAKREREEDLRRSAARVVSTDTRTVTRERTLAFHRGA